ncbi:MAG: F0F1 ATP synthase subunit A [Spirochaetaceae bacterium]|jgi:F-type H+-transporting ATPase subunit a|nr:F0F1 ATP synthase subunit A [Spirochaetaceae bacterium]
MSLNEKLQEALQINTIWTWHMGGASIPITETVVTTWVCMAICIAGGLWWRSRLEKVPRGKQIFLEWAVDFVNNICKSYFGKYSRYFSAYLGTLFMFIFLMNLIPVLSPISGFGFTAPFDIKPPTRDINVTAALAIVSIVMVIVASIGVRGMKGFLKTFIDPMPVMLPFNILDYITKPLSLCLRLFGNMLGAFIIMQMLEYIFPLIVPMLGSSYFDWFDGTLQALVFSFLTVIYLNMGMGIEFA